MNLVLRDATATDMAALLAIYSHHVVHGFGTFDEVPPPLNEMRDKWRGVVASGLPWLVAEAEGAVVGYAYASIFRPRTGYRYSVEDSVYVRDDQRGRGVGAQLLKCLIPRCEAVGVRQVIAVIGDSKNTGSIALHRNAGFDHAGTIKGVGFKLGRWVDIVMMQRALNGGDESLPPVNGAWTLA
ncbi:MAG: GNAT family N-acetyltransferase [Alphaproteobacteria bacterium]|nr:GNAT family N-acetyltransferase [Alphaproteobacteria bacterium]